MDTETEYGVAITNRYAFLEDNEEDVPAEMPKKEEKVNLKVKGAKSKTSAAVKSGKCAAAAASKTDNSRMKGSFINLYVKGNYVFVIQVFSTMLVVWNSDHPWG
jgi:lipocalin